MPIRVLIASLLAFASPLLAQARRDSSTALPPLIVTATRAPLDRAAAPSSVTVLSGDDLRVRGITNVIDALRDVPGVAIAQTGSFGGTTSLFLRGGQSNYTKVMIDGVPVNQPGVAFDFGTLTTDNVDRIEILRGPGSVVWGADAVTGVINVITRVGTGGARLRAAARAGTYGSVDAEGDVSGQTNATGYSFGLARHSTKGIYDFNNRYTVSVLSGRANIRPDDKSDGTLTVRYTDYASHYPTDFAGTPVDQNAFRAESKLALGADLGRRLRDDLTLRLSLSSASADGGTDDAADVAGGSFNQTLDHLTRRGAELRAIHSLPNAQLTVGVQIEEQTQRSQSQSTFGNGVFSAARRNQAAYGELVTVRPRWSGTAGVRVDDNQEFGSFGTFRLGLRVVLPHNAFLRGNAGTGYREPSFFENYSTNPYARGNAKLDPEHSQSWEVGGGVSLLENRVTLSAVHFDQRFRDMIDYDGDAVAPDPSYQNRARASANGQEAELRVLLPMGFSATGSLTRVQTRVLDAGFDPSPTALLVQDEQLLRRPRSSAMLAVQYSRARWGSADLRATRIDSRQDRDYNEFPARAVTLPAYTLIDLSAELELLRTLTNRSTAPVITVRGSNLGDTEYQSVFGYRSPGRMILIGLRADF